MKPHQDDQHGVHGVDIVEGEPLVIVLELAGRKLGKAEGARGGGGEAGGGREVFKGRKAVFLVNLELSV